MDLLYVTDGMSLLDVDLRAQVIRLPEVISALRGLENKSLLGVSLLNALADDSEFKKFDPQTRAAILSQIQQALMNRFLAKHSFERIVHRKDFETELDVVTFFRQLLVSEQKLCIFVIGPGLDRTYFLLKSEKNILFAETLTTETQLSWFWPEFLEKSRCQSMEL